MFWNKKEKTITNNNIVILGGGFSGLSIGIKLLKKGFNVTIVEKEDRLGGKLEFSNNVNVYPKYIYEYDKLISYLNELGLKNDCVLRYNKKILVYDFYGNEIILPSSFYELQKYLNFNSIDDDKKIKQLLDLIKKENNIEKTLLKYNSISINDYFEKFNSKNIKKLFYSLMDNDFSMSMLIEFLYNYYNSQEAIINNNIIKQMVDVYNELGGKTILNTNVLKINFDLPNHANEIETDNKKIKFDYLISTIDPKCLYLDLLKSKFNDRKFILRYEDFINYNVDSRLIFTYKSKEEVLFDNINIEVDDLNILSKKVKYLRFVRSNEDKSIIYCSIRINHNDYDYLNIISKNKNVYQKTLNNINQIIIDEFKKKNEDYIIKLLSITNPMDFLKKYNSYKGSLKGFLKLPKSTPMICDCIINSLKNVFNCSSWNYSDGGILNSLIYIDQNLDKIEKVIKNEKK